MFECVPSAGIRPLSTEYRKQQAILARRRSSVRSWTAVSSRTAGRPHGHDSGSRPGCRSPARALRSLWDGARFARNRGKSVPSVRTRPHAPPQAVRSREMEAAAIRSAETAFSAVVSDALVKSVSPAGEAAYRDWHERVAEAGAILDREVFASEAAFAAVARLALDE